MPDVSDGAEQSKQPEASGAAESLPPPSAADVPPQTHLTEDQLDAMENRRRKAGERWITDLALLALYILAAGLLWGLFYFVRHFLRR